LAAIAVPVYRGRLIYGAISILWAKSYMKHEAFARAYLEPLRRTTRLVSQDLERLQPQAAAPP
jgi:hypothetical protein